MMVDEGVVCCRARAIDYIDARLVVSTYGGNARSKKQEQSVAAGRLCVKSGSKGSAGGHSEYIDDADAPAPSPWARVAAKPKRDDIVARGAGNMPAWAITPVMFWQAADQYERTNGSAYREMEITLPRELDHAQRLALLHEWIEQEIGCRHAYQWAMHAPLAIDQLEQPHVHLMFSERQLDGIQRDPEQYFRRYNSKNPERGGARKGWGPHAGETRSHAERRADLVELRQRWEVMCNAHLAAAGVDARIDMRSYADRGIDLPPEGKLSPIDARDPAVIADLLELRAAKAEYRAAQAEADAVVVELSSRRPQAVAVVPEPEQVQAVAVPVPARPEHSAQQLERMIELGEAKLAELEARKQARDAAEAAYRRTLGPAEAAYRRCQELERKPLWRALAWLGVGPLAAADREREPVRLAHVASIAARKRAGAELQAAEQAAAGLPERIEGLRAELTAAREYDARDARAVDLAVALVARLDAALEAGDPRRDDWRTLDEIDRGRLVRWDLRDPYAPLRALLAAQPDTRIAMVAEISARLPELQAIEREERGPLLGHQAPGSR